MISSEFRIEQCRDDDHRENEPHVTFQKHFQYENSKWSSGYELMKFESEMNGLEDGFGEYICEDFETDETENATLATEEIHDIDDH